MHIVLVQPQIPPNTGNIARLCAGLDIHLHLVKPLGFSVEDKHLKRAGLDYWPSVNIEYHDQFEDLIKSHPQDQFYFFTTKSSQNYTNIQFQENDWLVFGSETKGLSAEILESNWDHAYTIPMTKNIRSLNLATSVSMVIGEAMRQVRW